MILSILKTYYLNIGIYKLQYLSWKCFYYLIQIELTTNFNAVSLVIDYVLYEQKLFFLIIKHKMDYNTVDKLISNTIHNIWIRYICNELQSCKTLTNVIGM